jgi:hypothetical protein
MKMKSLSVIVNIIGCIVLLLAGCSKENSSLQNELVNMEEAGRILINIESYQSEQSFTRAGQTQTTEVVDLGNNLFAEVSLEKDEQKGGLTRAVMSEEHYTIFALNSAGVRVATMKGKVKDGIFKRDTGSPKMELTPGAYTFVCINDAVTDNTTSLSVTNGSKNPMIGRTQQTISGAGDQIVFIMKHQTARVHFSITSYTSASSGVKAIVSSDESQLNKNIYDLSGENITSTENDNVQSGEYTFPATPAATRSFYTLPYSATSAGYQYFLPNLEGKDLKLTFNAGMVYGESLAGKSIKLTKIGKLLRNGSYKLNIKLKNVLYLFADGTVGTFKEKAERQPIGVVITDKTPTQEGLAMALKHTDRENWVVKSKSRQQSNSAPLTSDFLTKWNDYDGYKWTWEKEGSADGVTIKANSTDYPAFYAAAHYQPGPSITGTNIGKWFLPSLGQIKLSVARLCRDIDVNAKTDWEPYSMYRNLDANFDKIFLQAGGQTLVNAWLWTSSECTTKNAHDFAFREEWFELDSYGTLKHTDLGDFPRVRPFVKY